MEDILARAAPSPLAVELREIARRRTELESALAVQNLSATRVGIRQAAAQRERAFLDELQRLADKSR
jgi:hypothetical protein